MLEKQKLSFHKSPINMRAKSFQERKPKNTPETFSQSLLSDNYLGINDSDFTFSVKK